MSFNKNWNIDSYRTEYESEEHWQLRRRFMEVHKNKFPEDELVCLAQVFTNVEFMGCKYPDETMRLVGELSQDVAKEFREGRAKKIKRTFVKASDAAEARAKGSRKSRTFSHADREGGPPRKQLGVSLLSGLPFGNFILMICPGYRESIAVSGRRCGVKVEEKETMTYAEKRIELFVNGKLAGCGCGASIKIAKQNAFETAMAKLQEDCFTIKPKPNPDRIDITKNNETILCNLKSSDVETTVDPNNIGYKIMRKLGWTGGGLGSAQSGQKNPVDYLIKNNRRGLGNESGDINKSYFKTMLQNYVRSDDIRDLFFDSNFTKDERAELHGLAGTIGLKSVSSGKEPNRHLVISKKDISFLQILQEILFNRNPMYINKYEVTAPVSKRNEFPDHLAFTAPAT